MDEDLDDEVGAAVRARVAAARPELDHIRAAVIRANAAAAVFGAAPRVLVARYELHREVGTGGGGSVFVARDPDLEREIALKLISAPRPELRARAVAEGQALARLAHPNVVSVFDVGIDDDRVYLAMELVRGETLRSYAAHATEREIVDAYRQAGEGLLAAHGAGLVHGDFKPDNAVIGSDGRVRIIDFGLAGTDGSQLAGGTPRYMPPEQHAGEAATASVDRFAFATALREALTGLATGVPRWLAPVLDRATSAAPEARYASMQALLAALANDPRTRWRRRAMIALPLVVLLVAGAAFAVGRRAQPAADTSCEEPGALGSVWNEDRAERIRARVVGLGTPYALATAPRVRPQIDAYAKTWLDARRSACLAARTEPSEQVVYRRTSCTAAARSQLEGALGVLEGTNVDTLPGAIRALSELPDPARCGDANALLDDIPPPPPDQLARVTELRADLARVRARTAAAMPDAAEHAAVVVASARRLGYRPLLAQALLEEGHALDAIGKRAAGVSPLGEAMDLALPVRDDATAVEAYARLLRAAGEDSGPLAGLRPVVAVAERLRSTHPFVVALLHNHAGVAELGAGRPARAKEQWRAALPLAREVTGAGAVELAWVRTNLALLLEPGPERDALLAEAVNVTRQRLGDEHPLTLRIEIAAAFAVPAPTSARAALAPPCKRLADLHPAQRAARLECQYELAVLGVLTGDLASARESFADAAAIAAGPDVSRDRRGVAAAFVSVLSGDRRAAEVSIAQLAEELRPTPTTLWHHLLFPADVEIGRALLARGAGKPRQQAAALDLAIQYLERAAKGSALLVITRRLDAARAMRAEITERK